MPSFYTFQPASTRTKSVIAKPSHAKYNYTAQASTPASHHAQQHPQFRHHRPH
ncbi:MAG: hypothetical protein MJE68_30745 [Proteobacteria bacterium]|nr:hypothetical protein [Pseudomonadota bacterium]